MALEDVLMRLSENSDRAVSEQQQTTQAVKQGFENMRVQTSQFMKAIAESQFVQLSALQEQQREQMDAITKSFQYGPEGMPGRVGTPGAPTTTYTGNVSGIGIGAAAGITEGIVQRLFGSAAKGGLGRLSLIAAGGGILSGVLIAYLTTVDEGFKEQAEQIREQIDPIQNAFRAPLASIVAFKTSVLALAATIAASNGAFVLATGAINASLDAMNDLGSMLNKLRTALSSVARGSFLFAVRRMNINISALVARIDKVTDAVSVVRTLISGNMMKVFGNFSGSFTKMNGILLGAVNVANRLLVGPIKGLVGGVGRMGAGSLQLFAKSIAPFAKILSRIVPIGNVLALAVSAFDAARAGFEEWEANQASGMKLDENIVQTAAAASREFVDSFLFRPIGWLTDATATALEYFGADAAAENLRNFKQSVTNLYNSIFGDGPGQFANKVGSVYNEIKLLLSGDTEARTRLVDNIDKMVDNSFTSIINFIGGMLGFDSLSKKIDIPTQKIMEYATDIWNATIGNALSALGQVGNRLLEIDFSGSANDIGKEMTSFFIDAFGILTGTIRKTIGDLANVVKQLFLDVVPLEARKLVGLLSDEERAKIERQNVERYLQSFEQKKSDIMRTTDLLLNRYGGGDSGIDLMVNRGSRAPFFRQGESELRSLGIEDVQSVYRELRASGRREVTRDELAEMLRQLMMRNNEVTQQNINNYYGSNNGSNSNVTVTPSAAPASGTYRSKTEGMR